MLHSFVVVRLSLGGPEVKWGKYRFFCYSKNWNKLPKLSRVMWPGIGRNVQERDGRAPSSARERAGLACADVTAPDDIKARSLSRERTMWPHPVCRTWRTGSTLTHPFSAWLWQTMLLLFRVHPLPASHCFHIVSTLFWRFHGDSVWMWYQRLVSTGLSILSGILGCFAVFYPRLWRYGMKVRKCSERFVWPHKEASPTKNLPWVEFFSQFFFLSFLTWIIPRFSLIHLTEHLDVLQVLL